MNEPMVRIEGRILQSDLERLKEIVRRPGGEERMTMSRALRHIIHIGLAVQRVKEAKENEPRKGA